MDLSGAESGVFESVAGAIVVQLIFSLALFAWGRWVARRKGTAGWRRAAWMPLVALVLAIAGVTASTLALLRSFQAIANADPAEKARLLAEHISEAMNATAFFAIPTVLLYLASVVAFFIGSVTRPASS